MKISYLLPLLLVGIILVSGCITGDVPIETGGEHDELAQCLTDNDVKMYGTEWCSYCKKQKELFGDSFELIDYIDCDKDPSACKAAGITGYPTWVIDGDNYAGVQPLERLARLSGCE